MIKLKQILNEQGPTPAPKPNFKPGELTDPNFMADWNNYSLSTGAKQTRYKDFMKRQQDILDDAKKEYELAHRGLQYGSEIKDRVFGDYYAFKEWFSSIFNFMGTAAVTLPKNYIEYVSNEIELGKDPKSLEELWPYIKQNLSPKKNDLKTSNTALEKAISKVKSLNEQSDSPTVIHTNLYNRYRITDPKIINLLETFAQLYVEIVEEAGKDVTLIHSYEIPDILNDNTTNMTEDDYNLVKKNTWFLFDRALEITRTKK